MSTAWVVAGPPAVGKSTLGAALARRLGAALLDLDTVTNPLLDAVFAGVDGHWNDDERRSEVRPARYAVLRGVAADQVASGLDVVLVAPFTAELAGGPEWDLLHGALRPAVVRVAWLSAPPGVLAARMSGRASARDAATRRLPAYAEPLVPHVAVDATLPVEEQVSQVVAAGTLSG